MLIYSMQYVDDDRRRQGYNYLYTVVVRTFVRIRTYGNSGIVRLIFRNTIFCKD